MRSIRNQSRKKVIAAVIEKDGKYLIAQRAKKDHLFGKWEFPGGKVEAGETFQECLKRELFEEFSIQAEIGDFLCTSYFENNGVEMELLAYRVVSFTGTILLNEHTAVAWVAPEDFLHYQFPEPDLPIIAALRK